MAPPLYDATLFLNLEFEITTLFPQFLPKYCLPIKLNTTPTIYIVIDIYNKEQNNVLQISCYVLVDVHSFAMTNLTLSYF